MSLQQRFKLKELGKLKYIPGIEFVRSNNGIFMHQKKYAVPLIYEVGLSSARTVVTPMDVNMKLTCRQYDDQTKENQGETLED